VREARETYIKALDALVELASLQVPLLSPSNPRHSALAIGGARAVHGLTIDIKHQYRRLS
jgi:hypothetical protein